MSLSHSIVLHGLDLLYALSSLALIALGLAIVFGLLGVLNMAHGEFVMIGAYTAVAVQGAGWPSWLSLPLCIVVCIGLGYGVERWLIRPLYARSFDTLLATWGLALLLRKLIEAMFGRGYRNVQTSLDGAIRILGVQYPAYRVVLMGGVVIGLALLYLWYRRSTAGLRVRAMVSNPILAQALGIDTRRVASWTFVVGVVFAGMAGLLLAPLVPVEPGMGVNFLLNAFFALVVGGLGSFGAFAGGVGVVGGVQSVASSVISSTFGYALVLTISILLLWLKPDGLFTRR
ncbi:branched-chain amino acid ABC transporter permease [Thiomonas sp. FB-6]|uniref:branched-chain amino acid ABC transporter permease n=1 Tax=Thiomonas sp. FB-6 TaxID=1158291 RepID=UPI00037D7B26|nr:branched-chain amino acid ABC transporter permease [Thiomonas sp. FB-6]